MPAHPHPPRGDQPFPRSRGWSGQIWGSVIDYHVRSQAAANGYDYFIGFDDDDRLCVTCHGEKGYATRIPLALVEWTEREMRAANIEALPNHPRQFRLARGAGNSRVLHDHVHDIGVLKADIAERTGVDIDDLRIFPGPQIVNLSIDGEGPILLRETAMDRFAISWLERHDNDWFAFNGVIDPREADKVQGSFSTKDVRHIRGGAVINWMISKLEERVTMDADILGSVAAMSRAQSEDPMNKDMVIEVSCLVDFEDLDADDQTIDGNCSVDGSYGLTLTDVPTDADWDAIVDATSLQFHRHVAISCLDDFDITYRKRNALDDGLHELETFPFERDEPLEP